MEVGLIVFRNILIINLITHLLILFVNYKKSEEDMPIFFKVIFYFLLFGVNVVTFCISLFIINLFEQKLIYSYIILTGILFIFHFILDEDWIFRFEKIINVVIVMLLNITFYGLWYTFLF